MAFIPLTKPTGYPLPAVSRTSYYFIEIAANVDISKIRHGALCARIHDSTNNIGSYAELKVIGTPIWPYDGDARPFEAVDSGRPRAVIATDAINGTTPVGTLVVGAWAEPCGPGLRVLISVFANDGTSHDYAGGLVTLSVGLLVSDS